MRILWFWISFTLCFCVDSFPSLYLPVSLYISFFCFYLFFITLLCIYQYISVSFTLLLYIYNYMWIQILQAIDILLCCFADIIILTSNTLVHCYISVSLSFISLSIYIYLEFSWYLCCYVAVSGHLLIYLSVLFDILFCRSIFMCINICWSIFNYAVVFLHIFFPGVILIWYRVSVTSSSAYLSIYFSFVVLFS